MSQCENGNCVQGFSLGEKFVVRGAFVLGIALGCIAIWPESVGLALGYAAYALVSYTLLMRYTVCARCPHLLEAGDCLFVPASLVRRFVADRSGPLTVAEHGIILAAIVGTALLPMPWLWGNLSMLLLYILASAGWMAYLFLRVCVRCQVEVCPVRKYAQKG